LGKCAFRASAYSQFQKRIYLSCVWSAGFQKGGWD
jgi:hypothetical protein